MKYQITCANCNKRFLVEGKGGQTIECTCPGCGGKMRVDLPKSKKGDSGDEEDPNEIYQQGYVPGDNENTDYGGDGDDDNGGKGKRRRSLALGCAFFIVVAAAAIVAFMALNHTTKKPIEDPYEYVEPDTASTDTVPEDTEEVQVDTVQVHQEAPKVEAAPVDTASEAPATDNAEATEQTEPSADAATDGTPKASSKASAKERHGSNADQPAKEGKATKPSKKADAASTANE